MTHGQGLQVAKAGVGKPPLPEHVCFCQDLAGLWPVGELSSFFVFIEGDCPLSRSSCFRADSVESTELQEKPGCDCTKTPGWKPLSTCPMNNLGL